MRKYPFKVEEQFARAAWKRNSHPSRITSIPCQIKEKHITTQSYLLQRTDQQQPQCQTKRRALRKACSKVQAQLVVVVQCCSAQKSVEARAKRYSFCARKKKVCKHSRFQVSTTSVVKPTDKTSMTAPIFKPFVSTPSGTTFSFK